MNSTDLISHCIVNEAQRWFLHSVVIYCFGLVVKRLLARLAAAPLSCNSSGHIVRTHVTRRRTRTGNAMRQAVMLTVSLAENNGIFIVIIIISISAFFVAQDYTDMKYKYLFGTNSPSKHYVFMKYVPITSVQILLI